MNEHPEDHDPKDAQGDTGASLIDEVYGSDKAAARFVLDLLQTQADNAAVRELVDLISFVAAPSTPEERLRRLDKLRRLTYSFELKWEHVPGAEAIR